MGVPWRAGRPGPRFQAAWTAAAALLWIGLAAGMAGDVTDATKASEAEARRYWPQWRGPLNNGVAPNAHPPLAWSETKNIRWKIALPGAGHSSPVIWGDRVFVTAAIPYGELLPPVYNQAPGAHDNRPVSQWHRFVLFALHRADGRVLWQKTLREALPHEGGHFSGSLASSSPATDGERVYAFFGTQGLYCLDMNGEPLWNKDFGRMDTLHAHGEGSSPALDGGDLVVNWDHEKGSFVTALDKRTGATRWRVERDEETSWSSPLVVEHGGKRQVVVSATKRVRSYDLETGALLWECAGLARNVVATPVAGDGMVYVGNSYDKQSMFAIRLEGAHGDVTGTDHVAWSLNRLTPYVPSPLLYGDTLYFLRHNQGVLSRLTAKTGEPKDGPFRLNEITSVFASPVGAMDRVYITDRDGTTLVFRHGAQPGALAVNRLNDAFSASAALVDGEIYLRGEKNLYCVAEP